MSQSRRIAYLVSTIALVLALLTGCGSDSGESSTGSSEDLQTSNLSKDQWIKKAEEACVTDTVPILEKVNAFEEQHVSPIQSENERIAGKGIRREVPPIMAVLSKDLRGLGAPEGDEKQVEAFIVAFEADTEKIATGPALTGLGDLDEQYRSSGKLARQYGLVGCAFG